MSGWPEASLEVLKDYVHAISLYLLDSLPEPPCEVSYGFLSYFIIVYKELMFLFYHTKQRY